MSSPNDRRLYAFEAKGRYGVLAPFMGERLDRKLIDDATSYCIPFYVVKIPWLFGRDLMLPDGLARFSPLRDLAS